MAFGVRTFGRGFQAPLGSWLVVSRPRGQLLLNPGFEDPVGEFNIAVSMIRAVYLFRPEYVYIDDHN